LEAVGQGECGGSSFIPVKDEFHLVEHGSSPEPAGASPTLKASGTAETSDESAANTNARNILKLLHEGDF
jgi:hypothetical protein